MRETNFARQQRDQAKQLRENLKVASVHFTRLGPGVYNRAQINDGVPATYRNGTYVGEGPANPNWFRHKTERAVSEKQMWKEVYDSEKRAQAAEAKKAGYPSYEAMQKAKQDKEYDDFNKWAELNFRLSNPRIPNKLR